MELDGAAAKRMAENQLVPDDKDSSDEEGLKVVFADGSGVMVSGKGKGPTHAM